MRSEKTDPPMSSRETWNDVCLRLNATCWLMGLGSKGAELVGVRVQRQECTEECGVKKGDISGRELEE